MTYKCVLNIVLLACLSLVRLNYADAFAPTGSFGVPTRGYNAIFAQGNLIPTTRPTRLFSEPPKKSVNEIIGIDRGLYLLAFVVAFNVWIFSIPPEFRRAKLCSEEQVRQYPDSACMTAGTWTSGVSEYYANGGGVQFDFSVEKKSQPIWMGGEEESFH